MISLDQKQSFTNRETMLHNNSHLISLDQKQSLYEHTKIVFGEAFGNEKWML